jgi:hypothetical protein
VRGNLEVAASINHTLYDCAYARLTIDDLDEYVTGSIPELIDRISLEGGLALVRLIDSDARYIQGHGQSSFNSEQWR